MTTPCVPQSQGQHSTNTSEAMTDAGGLLPEESLLPAVVARPLSRLLSCVIGCGCRCLLTSRSALLIARGASSSRIHVAIHDVWDRKGRGLHGDVHGGWAPQRGRVRPLQGPVAGRVGVGIIVEAASAFVSGVAVHSTSLAERGLAWKRTAAQHRRMHVPVQSLLVEAGEHR